MWLRTSRHDVSAALLFHMFEQADFGRDETQRSWQDRSEVEGAQALISWEANTRNARIEAIRSLTGDTDVTAKLDYMGRSYDRSKPLAVTLWSLATLRTIETRLEELLEEESDEFLCEELIAGLERLRVIIADREQGANAQTVR